MRKSPIGQTHLIMMTNNFFDLKGPELSTSSVMNLVPTTNPMKIQVTMATIGIMMELEMKSKKSRNV